MLPRLRHGPVGGRHHHDGAIHLRRPRDHVLDVIRVPRAIHVRVVPLGGLVLDVRHGNGDAAGLFFRRVIDGIEAPELDLGVVLAQHLRDGRRQGGLAVIDVPDRPDIHVRLAAVEFFLCHKKKPLSLSRNPALDLVHDLLGDPAGNFLVLAKMHGETAAALRPAP